MHIVIITSAMICTTATTCDRRSHSHHPPAATEWSVLLLHDVICSERVTMHCQWGGKPTKLPLSLGISSPCRRRTEPRP